MRLVYSKEELQALRTALAEVLYKCLDGGLDHPHLGVCGLVDDYVSGRGIGYTGLGYDFMDTVFNLWPHSLRYTQEADRSYAKAMCYPIPNVVGYGRYEGKNLAYRINAMEFAVKLCAAMLAAYELGEHNVV